MCASTVASNSANVSVLVLLLMLVLTLVPEQRQVCGKVCGKDQCVALQMLVPLSLTDCQMLRERREAQEQIFCTIPTSGIAQASKKMVYVFMILDLICIYTYMYDA